MPIYEFYCEDCRQSFETLVRAHDPRTECPHCHSNKLTRELSVFASARGGAESAATDVRQSAAPSGGCCGGGCGCR